MVFPFSRSNLVITVILALNIRGSLLILQQFNLIKKSLFSSSFISNRWTHFMMKTVKVPFIWVITRPSFLFSFPRWHPVFIFIFILKSSKRFGYKSPKRFLFRSKGGDRNGTIYVLTVYLSDLQQLWDRNLRRGSRANVNRDYSMLRSKFDWWYTSQQIWLGWHLHCAPVVLESSTLIPPITLVLPQPTPELLFDPVSSFYRMDASLSSNPKYADTFWYDIDI